MKVTVCFWDIKVVVPCGDGSGLVKNLLEEAIARYRKAQEKNSESCWLSLKTVKLLLCDGGILDLDDRIVDVIDDKEQIQAIVDSNNNRLLQEHNDNNGDGTSVSSLGTYSPDNFSDRICNGKETSDLLGDGRHDVIITEQDFLAESGLCVRRGSEPTLCTSSDLESSGIEVSAEYPIYSSVRKNAGDRIEPMGSNFQIACSANAGQMAAAQQTVDAATRISEEQENEQDDELIVVLPKSKEALGIHVVPEFDRAGRNIGLLIEKIEHGGRADRDHRLQKGDKIIEINFQNLFQVDFPKAQEIFRSSFLAPELQIKLLRPVKSASQTASPDHRDRNDSVSIPGGVDQKHRVTAKRIPPAVPARNPKTRLSLKAPASLTMQSISIELVKGANGLGFSVTTHGIRDGGSCPIYVKNIFSVGAAIQDGRLKPGDVILEINGVPLMNKTKAEAVRLLRNFPTGSTIQLIISRAHTPDETDLQQRHDPDRRPVMQSPHSAKAFHLTSTSSSSDRTEEDGVDDDGEPQDVGVQENVTGSRKFGSMSNIAKSGISDDFEDEEDPNFALDLQTDERGTSSTLQKSRKSISMDDLRRTFARSVVEVSFDDDVDFPAAPFQKMRDFNQSFRAAVIDKAYNRPATGAGADSVEYISAIEKIEKLRQNGEKKNKNKKERDGGSGRKFGWLFRFGKGRKSDNERNQSASASEVPSSRNVSVKMEKSPVQELPSSNIGLPVTGPKIGPTNQSPSHLSGHSRFPSELVKEVESGFARLHKEDYMIATVTPQQVTSHQDRLQIHARHAAADRTYNEPQHQQRLNGRWDERSRQHEGVSDRHDVSQQQFHRPISSHIHRESPLLGPSNIYHDPVYPKSVDPNRRFHRQELPPPGGNFQPPLNHHHDDHYGLRSYQTDYLQEQRRSQFIKPNAVALPPQRELQSSAPSGHYYRRDNFEGQGPLQYQNVRTKPNYYTEGPTWDQSPLDLSRYAVRTPDRVDVGYGYRSRDYDLQARQQTGSDMKIPHQPSSSAYPQYPGIAIGSDFASEQARQMQKNSRSIVEHRQHGDHYQAKILQNNPTTFITERR